MQGAQGLPGVQGPQGAQGATGAQGVVNVLPYAAIAGANFSGNVTVTSTPTFLDECSTAPYTAGQNEAAVIAMDFFGTVVGPSNTIYGKPYVYENGSGPSQLGFWMGSKVESGTDFFVTAHPTLYLLPGTTYRFVQALVTNPGTTSQIWTGLCQGVVTIFKRPVS